MSGQVQLKRLLSQDRRAFASLLEEMTAAMDSSVNVQDATGIVLLGTAIEDAQEQHPVECNGEVIGWAVGGEGS